MDEDKEHKKGLSLRATAPFYVSVIYHHSQEITRHPFEYIAPIGNLIEGFPYEIDAPAPDGNIFQRNAGLFLGSAAFQWIELLSTIG